MDIEFNENKFRELLLYIADKSKDDPKFGATKLNKLMYYSDFGFYMEHGRPITGATYYHFPAGPVPGELKAMKPQLKGDEDARWVQRRYFGGIQARLEANRAPNLTYFTPEELALVDDVVDYFRPFDGRSISDYSHREWGYKTTYNREAIPYFTALISLDLPTEEQLQMGQTVAEEQGLLAG